MRTPPDVRLPEDLSWRCAGSTRSNGQASSSLRAWAAASGGAPVGVSGRLRDAAEDLAIAADRRPGDLVAAASRFGWQAGDDGWPLAEIARWLETLARISGPSGKGLLDLRGRRGAVGRVGRRVPPRRRPGRLPRPDHAAWPASASSSCDCARSTSTAPPLGVEPDLVYALVVVDASLVEHPLFERNAARVALADEVRALFGTGETVAGHGDRVLVLVSRTPELDDRVAILDAAVHTHSLLRHDPIATWVERLPRTRRACAASSTT